MPTLLAVLLLLVPAPDPAPDSDLVTRWINLVGEDFPVRLWDDALAIIDCESDGLPHAINPVSGAAGLFQIKEEWWGFLLQPGESLFDPAVNVRVAAVIVESSENQGLDSWHYWACARVLNDGAPTEVGAPSGSALDARTTKAWLLY